MSASGAWFPAKLVMDACNQALNRTEKDLAERREDHVLRVMEAGRWSWLRLKTVPISREDAENNIHVKILDDFIKYPMQVSYYKKVMNLLALASQTENLMAGSQIFVSSNDIFQISRELKELKKDG